MPTAPWRGVLRPGAAGAVLALLCAAAVATSDTGAPLPGAAQLPSAPIERARERDLVERIASLERLVKQHPSDPVPYNELAVIHAGRGDLDGARTLLERAMEADPRYAVVYRNLQSVLGALAGRAYERALLATGSDTPVPALESIADGGMPFAGAAASPPARARVASVPVPSIAGDPPRLDAPPPAPAPAIVTPAATAAVDDVVATVLGWAKAWSRQDVEAYLSYYGHHFTPGGGTRRDRWQAERRRRVSAPKFIQVEITGIDVDLAAPTRATARFRQSYRSNVLSSTVTKVLQLSRSEESWKITRESVKR